MAIIEVDHVTKEFQLGELEGIKTMLRNRWRHLRGQPPEQRTQFKALDDITFSIEPGEVVGVIGHNGAGKSTLLKLLAGITSPTSGRIAVRGRVAPLIEVSAGFVGQLTGRENVYLNGAILGMAKAEIDRKFDEIVEFSGIGEFIDTPVKRYSSGMRVKLAFSVATSISAEILIVDEVLAVGDLPFQRKCFERMDQLIHREKRTVLFVSHNIRQVERICSRVIMLDHGRIVEDGAPAQVCSLYFNANNARHAKERAALARPPERMSDDLSSCEVDLGTQGKSIPYGSALDVRIRFNAVRPLRKVVFAVTLHTGDYVRVAVTESQRQPVDLPEGLHEVTLSIPRLPLLPGVYAVRLWIGTIAGHTIYVADHLAPFNIETEDFGVARLQEKGFVPLDGHWVLPAKSELVVDVGDEDLTEVEHGNLA